jgi:hypothetical protein
MFLKVHRAPDGCEVVAVCDCDLLNTTLQHGELSVQITEKFYGNRRASTEEVKAALCRAANANLIGAQAVELAVEMGLITRDACIEISGIPHAVIFQL